MDSSMQINFDLSEFFKNFMNKKKKQQKHSYMNELKNDIVYELLK